MKELVWSDALAQEILVSKVMINNEKRFIDGLGNSNYEETFNQLLNDASQIRRNPDPNTDVSTAHFLYPLVEKIGCNNSGFSPGMYCFLSPGIPEEYLNNGVIHSKYLFLDSGEAGSKCDYGYEDNDGLCKHIEPTTSTVSTTTVTTTTKTPTASISVSNQDVIEDSENNASNESSSSYPIFSMVHILVLLGLGYSIFT
ncbi:unnamed protein product [Caenorhabditis nigoni]